ncbi:MAG: VWA domain-containing protein [Hyphomicrobiaceae bacterium]
MIELAYPWFLALLPLPWFVWRFVPPYRHRVAALRVPFFHRIARASGVEPQAGSIITSTRTVEAAAAIGMWCLVILALARPERVGEPIEIAKAARDMVLAIDISGSMDEKDFKSKEGKRLQRLAAVKNVVGDFIEARKGDRVALIVFGSKAFVQAPFTEDLRTVRELLEETEVGMAGPHTVIGDAIGLAIRTFESSKIDQRLIVLLSDGEDTGSRMTPINAAAIAARNGVEIFTIGVGDPDGTGEYRIDTETLKEIADRTGGEFFFADDVFGLEAIYKRIEEMAPRKVETQSFRPRDSLVHWPLAAAFIVGFAYFSFATWRSSLRAAK